MNKFYINLTRCPDRTKYFDKSWNRWEATDWNDLEENDPIFKKMISYYNISKAEHGGKVGCLISHLTLLNHIVNNKLDRCIIVEDDAEQVNHIPDDLGDTFIYLGGFFMGTKMTDGDIPPPPMIEGINDIPENNKVMTTLSYYIPTYQIADEIIKQLEELNRFRAIDVLYNKLSLKRRVYYPALFIERDLQSTIRPSKQKHSTELYEFRKQKKMSFKVVIPSYNRYDKLKNFTLAYLDRHNIPHKDIFVFIREDDEEAYKYLILKEWGYNVVISKVKGIGKTHNFITEYFNEDEFIVEIDDDLKQLQDNQKRPILSFRKCIETIINKMKQDNISYSGIYQCNNAMFMSQCNEYTYDLRYMLGLLRIRRIKKDILLSTNYSEDFENAILHYIKDGKILKNNWLCGITSNYSPGGCDGDGRNIETEKKDKEYLANKYPEYCTLFQRKNGRWDLRLKHKKGN